MVAPELPYHITQRGTNRERVFFSRADRGLYLQLIRENLDDSKCRVLAYCLMTNHVHFVVVPQREDSLAVLFGRANGRYAQAVNIRKGRVGHLWHARYHSCAMSESHLWVGLRYVEANPCRAGMVKSPEEYPWSSAGVHLSGQPDRTGVLDLEFWRTSGGALAWAELHGAEVNPQQELELQRCTYGGRPFGEEAFVEEMEARFNRKWRRVTGSAAPELAISA